MKTFVLCALLGIATSRENDWQPIVSDSSSAYIGYAKTADKSIEAGPQLKILNRRPLQPSYSTNKLTSFYNVAPAPSSDTCSVYKVSMNQELFYQYLEYDKELPDLKEFTLCMWTKFHNHSEDHPLFSYAVGENPKEISSWISNTQEASYYSMAVHGQTFFRLNYPLKLNTCPAGETLANIPPYLQWRTSAMLKTFITDDITC